MGSNIDEMVRTARFHPMTGKRGLTRQHAENMLQGEEPGVAAERLKPDFVNLPRVPAGNAKFSRERAEALWKEIGGHETARKTLLDEAEGDLSVYQGNIENGLGIFGGSGKREKIYYFDALL